MDRRTAANLAPNGGFVSVEDLLNRYMGEAGTAVSCANALASSLRRLSAICEALDQTPCVEYCQRQIEALHTMSAAFETEVTRFRTLQDEARRAAKGEKAADA